MCSDSVSFENASTRSSRIGEPGPIREREGLGARPRVDIRLRESFGVDPPFQGVAQRLAPCREARTYEVEHAIDVPHAHSRTLVTNKPYERALDLGLGNEDVRRHGAHHLR